METKKIYFENESNLPIENIQVTEVNTGKSYFSDIDGNVFIEKGNFPIAIKAEGYHDMYITEYKEKLRLKKYIKWQDLVVNDQTLDDKIIYSKN